MRNVRLQVFVLVDTSGSMTGEPAEVLLKGLHRMQALMRQSDAIRQGVEICVIGFSDDAKILVPLSTIDLADFPLALDPAGSTAMAEAVFLMLGLLRTGRISSGPMLLPPIVLLITDGVATDDFDYALVRMEESRWSARVAWALPGADESLLGQFIGGDESVTNVVTLVSRGNSAHVDAFCALVESFLPDDDTNGDEAAGPMRVRPILPRTGEAGLWGAGESKTG